jgi:hypothetical protein
MTVAEHRSDLRCRRIAVTHMSAEMLARLGELPEDVLIAEDGTLVAL